MVCEKLPNLSAHLGTLQHQQSNLHIFHFCKSMLESIKQLFKRTKIWIFDSYFSFIWNVFWNCPPYVVFFRFVAATVSYFNDILFLTSYSILRKIWLRKSVMLFSDAHGVDPALFSLNWYSHTYTHTHYHHYHDHHKWSWVSFK